MRRAFPQLLAIALCTVPLLACGGDDDPRTPVADLDADATDETGTDADGTDVDVDGDDPDANAAPDARDDADADDVSGDGQDGDADASTDTEGDTDSARCDPIMPQSCAFPFPSNLYLDPDPSRTTGYTLRFGDDTLPTNRAGQPMPSVHWERYDGYTLGVPILAVLGDIDDRAFPGERNVGDSLEAASPIVLLEVGDDGVRRVPYWAEWADRQPDPDLRTVAVRPGEILREDTRYVVAFRNLEYRDGTPFERSEAFERLLTGATDGDPALAPRQARFDEIFAILEDAGVTRDSLSVAWDFHTVSHDALHGPILHMRDDALANHTPTFSLTAVREFVAEDDGSGLPVDDRIAFEIEGTFTVPWYLREESSGARTGWVLDIGEDGLPTARSERERPFWMLVPHSAIGTDALLVQYGHGLLGSGAQVFGSHNRAVAADHGLIFYSAYMTGMSEHDVTAAMHTATDAGRFTWLSAPLHQGLVEWVVLARHFPEWIAAQPVFTDPGIGVDAASPAYSGISQGGIFGLSFVALSPDVDRGHLGVPGNNYGILLERSADFVPYFTIADITYPTRHEQLLIIAAVGMLWESTDPVSYARHLSQEPLPGVSPGRVLLAPAKGDPEVAVVTNEVLARTADADIPLMRGYGRDVGFTEQADYPRSGSGVVLYDFGHPWPEPGLRPPDEYPELGDPHGLPKRSDHHNEQLAHFLRTGVIIDVCGGDGCTPD